jgi:hypothetical protein
VARVPASSGGPIPSPPSSELEGDGPGLEQPAPRIHPLLFVCPCYFSVLQWGFCIVTTDDFECFHFPCFMVYFCDVSVPLFSMLQYIIFDVVAGESASLSPLTRRGALSTPVAPSPLARAPPTPATMALAALGSLSLHPLCCSCMYQLFQMFQSYVAVESYGCCKSRSGMFAHVAYGCCIYVPHIYVCKCFILDVGYVLQLFLSVFMCFCNCFIRMF